MDIAAFEEALARELFGQELVRDISTRRLARRLSEIIQFRTAWTFQKWLSGEIQWGHDADLVWAALFIGLGQERLLEQFIGKAGDGQAQSRQPSDEEWRRVRRVAQMLRRGRYVGPQKTRLINEDDARYLLTGEMPDKRYLPLCASSGPPYVSSDDVEQLHLFVLDSASGDSVAFSYMDPVAPGLPGHSLEVHGGVQDFHELPAQPAQHVRDRVPLLSGAWRAAKRSSRAFENRMGLKLAGVEPVLTEGKGDAQEAVILNLQFSDYFKGRVTNHILDNIIPGRTPLPLHQDGNWKITYRDEWCGSMASFGDGLANLMQVNGFVVTTGDPGPPRVHLGVGAREWPPIPGSWVQYPTLPVSPAQRPKGAMANAGRSTWTALMVR